jgi:hypothetical protein
MELLAQKQEEKQKMNFIDAKIGYESVELSSIRHFKENGYLMRKCQRAGMSDHASELVVEQSLELDTNKSIIKRSKDTIKMVVRHTSSSSQEN